MQSQEQSVLRHKGPSKLTHFIQSCQKPHTHLAPTHTYSHTFTHMHSHPPTDTTGCGPRGALLEWGAGLCGSQSPSPAPSQPPNLAATSVLEKFKGNEGEHCFCLRHPQGPPGHPRPSTCTSSPRSLLFLLSRAIHAGQLPSHILHLGQEAKGTFSCPHAVHAGSRAAVPSTSCSASPRPHLWSHLEAGLSLQGPFAQLLCPHPPGPSEVQVWDYGPCPDLHLCLPTLILAGIRGEMDWTRNHSSSAVVLSKSLPPPSPGFLSRKTG